MVFDDEQSTGSLVPSPECCIFQQVIFDHILFRRDLVLWPFDLKI